MRSLESEIRDLMIAIPQELNGTDCVLGPDSTEEDWKTALRCTRLSTLSNRCLLAIDQEIEHFKK